MTRNAETILQQTRSECLRNMDSDSAMTRAAWYYTHCGEMEMAAALGHITIDRLNQLEQEWAFHSPATTAAMRRENGEPKSPRACDMDEVARSAAALLKLTRPDRDIAITWSKVSADSIGQFTEWQRQRCGILTGDEYFFVWDRSPDWDTDDPELLYAVCVTADSVLTAAAELMNLIARKF